MVFGELLFPHARNEGEVHVERFVSPDVTGGGSGTVDDPWPLRAGLDNVEAGDVLFLRGGSYAGNVTVSGRHGTAAKPLVGSVSLDGQ